MLITFYYLYLNIKNKMQKWFYNEPQITILETIVETTEESESSEKYDYNKYN